LNIKALIYEYLQDKTTQNLREATIQRYSYLLNNIFIKDTKITSSEQLSPKLINKWLLSRKSKVKSITLLENRNTIMSFINWCVDLEHIDDLKYSRHIKKPKCDRKIPRCLSLEEVEMLIKSVQFAPGKKDYTKKRDVAIIALLIDTGIREGELMRLNVTDMNPRQRSLRISEESKSRKERTAYYSERTQKYINQWLRVKMNGCDALFTTTANKRMSSGAVLLLIHTAAKLAKLKNVSPHTLRHSNATLMLKNGCDIKYIKDFLGHSDIRTTENYLHLLGEDMANKHDVFSVL